MNRLDDCNTYPIREFARLTGVNPVTLRAWERRYGIIRPERTPKGHRFYTEDHIQQVKHILYWLDQGYPIRQVRLLLQEGVEPDSARNDDWLEQQKLVTEAAATLNAQRLDELWNIGFATYPLAVYYDHCLRPALQTLRLDNTATVNKAAHFLLKRRLNSLLMQHQRHNPGPPVLVACDHPQAETDALACACALGAAEFRVDYFGCDTDISDLLYIQQHTGANTIWLHLHPLAPQNNIDWSALASEVHVPVIISGLCADTVDTVSDKVQFMQGSLSEQVRHFITGIAARLPHTEQTL